MLQTVALKTLAVSRNINFFLRVAVLTPFRSPLMALRPITTRATRFDSSVNPVSQIITPNTKFKPNANAPMEVAHGRKNTRTGFVSTAITNR